MMRRKLLIGALITLLGFPMLGWVILRFKESNPSETILRADQNLLIQISLGIIIGLALGWGAKTLISMKFLQPTLEKYSDLIGQFKLKKLDVIFISFCAGFGEELLFRGSLQVLMGIWLTAIVFVAIHGYLSPKNLKLSIYGIYMTIAIALLGYATEIIGIFAACTAHMIIDVILFYYLMNENQKIQNQTINEI